MLIEVNKFVDYNKFTGELFVTEAVINTEQVVSAEKIEVRHEGDWTEVRFVDGTHWAYRGLPSLLLGKD